MEAASTDMVMDAKRHFELYDDVLCQLNNKEWTIFNCCLQPSNSSEILEFKHQLEKRREELGRKFIGDKAYEVYRKSSSPEMQ